MAVKQELHQGLSRKMVLMINEYSFERVLIYCPGCGSKGQVLNSSGGLSCPSCGMEFFFNTAAAVAALITDVQGRLLLTLRKVDPGKGMLDLPGGFVHHGERAEEALVREVFEELGVTISGLEYFGSWPNTYLYSGLEYRTLDLAFKAKIISGTEIKPGDDVSDFVFLPLDEILLEKIAFESIRAIIAEYINRCLYLSAKKFMP